MLQFLLIGTTVSGSALLRNLTRRVWLSTTILEVVSIITQSIIIALFLFSFSGFLAVISERVEWDLIKGSSLNQPLPDIFIV